MPYTGMELLMENLKQLSYCNDNPLINNNRLILWERPQIQLLYKELSFMIEILFVEKENGIHELEEVRNLKTRFKDLAQEAHSIVGCFVSTLSKDFVNRMLECSLKPEVTRLINPICFLNLKNVMRSIKSIKEEFIAINISPSSDPLNSKYVGTSSTRNPLGRKKVLKEMVVGLERDADLIRDQLVQDQKQLDVISIVGMGGLGKTTLATKVFDDPFVVYHFHVRVWVTVSQTYERRDFLIQILAFMNIELEPQKDSDSQLREKLHKRLMGKRYLIVIDDIWSIKAWDDLKRFFPNDNTGSRILLTSRLKEVASHAKSHGFVHQLEYLTDQESWELLRKKVFHRGECPEWLIKTGMQIAKNCHGLPLAVVVIAGVLAQEETLKDLWEEVAVSVSSYIKNDQNGYLDTLALSYHHLSHHLRECFLYLGAFPEDFKFSVQRLIWLWMAEGFIQQAENQSLEETAEGYLMELVDRNLVVVQARKFNGAIKTCSIHDILRELCLKKATEESFYLKIPTPGSSLSFTSQYKPPRIFTNVESFASTSVDQASPRVHSLFCFHSSKSRINLSNTYIYSFPLLMVLDLQMCRQNNFPHAIHLLVHLRYLAFWNTGDFPSSICNLWSLQTLIVKCFFPLVLPKTISNLVNLRHLMSDRIIHFTSTEKPMNLQTISLVALVDRYRNWVECIPRIKKLTSSTRADEDHDFGSLTSLETLMWVTVGYNSLQKIHMRLPVSLKKLSLAGCYLPWSDMSLIQSLPNLEVLKILKHAFLGPLWETGEKKFQQLKFLKLQCLDIQEWEASDINFPCLKQLVLEKCKDLKEIPLELGDIPTLELIEVDNSSSTVVESLDKIKEEQQNLGNYDLKINVKGRSFLANLLSSWPEGVWNCFSKTTTKVNFGCRIQNSEKL